MPDYDLNPLRYFPCFQPIVDLVSGHISGYEALARFTNNEGALCSAGHLFHSSINGSDEVLAIDRHVRTTALQKFAKCADAGYLTINVSPHWIDRLQGDASPTIDIIEKIGIDPKRVVIEITESYGELSQIQRLVADYHRVGLRVAIDDFGAGASQIDRIVALKPDIIKLDMQLFKKAAKGGLTADVTLAAATIAGRIGCDIVCEGVETVEELHFGIECGARYIQGFIFYPAVAEFLPANATYGLTRDIQRAFLQRKTAILKTTALHNQTASNWVMSLRQHLLAGNVDELPAGQMFQNGILRYYLCGPNGTQISDNFEVCADSIKREPWGCECNWSHRPYFPLLIALESSIDRKLVVSNSYRDIQTHRLCKTYVTYLSNNEVLLVDVAVWDEVLYTSID